MLNTALLVTCPEQKFASKGLRVKCWLFKLVVCVFTDYGTYLNNLCDSSVPMNPGRYRRV